MDSRTRNALVLSALAVSALAADAGAQAADTTRLVYPETKTVPVAEDYHGTTIHDPYRWLEDPDAAETRAWVEAQNALTFGFLERIPQRAAIRERLERVWNYPKYGVPFREGARTFWFENTGLQNQSVLWVQDTPGAAPRVLLDPNALSADGTVALSGVEVSPDGTLLAYGTSASGSDWQEWHVRDIASGRERADTLRWIKFSGVAWTKDGAGFYYARYDEPAGENALTSVVKNQKLYYHRLGTPQSADVLVYADPEHPERGVGVEVTDDGRWAVLTIWEGTDERNRLYYMDLGEPLRPDVTAPVVRLLDDFDATWAFVDAEGPTFFLRTNKEAPRGKVVAIDVSALAGTGGEAARTIVPETTDALQSVRRVGDRLVAEYLADARSTVRLHALDGAPRGELALPGLGSVSLGDGGRERTDFHFSFTSFLSPTTIWHHDLLTGASRVHGAPEVPVDLSQFETRQIFATSRDGTRVPIFVTARKGLALDGSNPTLLYSYGGFNVPLTPSFSPATLVWHELGGVYAVANIRGGGEYGREWHEAGMFERKQNVFDDFIAAAEHLIAERYTSPAKLAIAGGSNGGLLVGAAMAQRPELFGAALPAVGVMDMLRYHRFTIGWAWAAEYGSADDSTQFEYLRAYSPLHNLEPGTRYPATLVTTADHDDRVVPAHSFKFAAALQRAQAGPAPVLIRIETKAGHGAGKPTSKQIEEAADRWAFLVKVLGVRAPDAS